MIQPRLFTFKSRQPCGTRLCSAIQGFNASIRFSIMATQTALFRNLIHGYVHNNVSTLPPKPYITWPKELLFLDHTFSSQMLFHFLFRTRTLLSHLHFVCLPQGQISMAKNRQGAKIFDGLAFLRAAIFERPLKQIRKNIRKPIFYKFSYFVKK